MISHYFQVDIAVKYGVDCAIMLEHLYFWIIHNRANGKNHINGKYWTYNSSRAFQELLPYWNKRQIEYILQKLKESGLIETDHHAPNVMDRTMWYTLSDEALKLYENVDVHLQKNGNVQITESVNVARASIENTGLNTGLNKKEKIDKRESSELSSAEDSEVIQTAENIWKIYPRKTKYTETLLEIKYAILREYRKLGDDPKALKKAIVLVYNAAAKYSNRVRRYSPEEQKYVISSTAFFRDCRYLDDPETWKGAAERSIVYNADGTRRGVL